MCEVGQRCEKCDVGIEHVTIKSFQDFDVYRGAYEAALDILTNVVPRLPREESRDLADQLRRAYKSIPTLIAEGYASKHHKKQFRKYLEGALAECIDTPRINSLVDTYNRLGKQLFRLADAWEPFVARGSVTHFPRSTSRPTSHLPDPLLTSGAVP